MISAYWLIPTVFIGFNAGVALMAIFAAGAQSDTRLDRSEDNPSSKVAKAVPTIHEKGA